MPTFGAVLKQYLQDRDRLQQHLADDLGVHRNTLGRWIRGDRQPDIAWVQDIADTIGLDPRERRQLYLAAGYMPDVPPPQLPYDEHTPIDITDDLDTIKGIVREIRAMMNDTQRLSATLDRLEDQRRHAIRNLSQTQRQVIAIMPTHPLRVAVVLQHIRKHVPSLHKVRTKELHFRLHELRYLGLIRRKKDMQEDWLYWVDVSQLWLLDSDTNMREDR